MGCFASFAQGDIVHGLQGYWRFDGSGLEASGGARDLTLVGNPGFPAGLIGSAMALDGSGSTYAVRPVNDAEFQLAARDFTIQAWVRYNSLAGEQVVVEKWTGMSGPGWTFTKLASHQYRFHLSTPVSLDTSLPSMAPGHWYHLIVVRRGPTLSILVDGQARATALVGTAANSETSAPLLVGRRHQQDGRVFATNGQLDEVAIWQRALSDDEIAWLYQSGQGRTMAKWIHGRVGLADFVGDATTQTVDLELVPVGGGDPIMLSDIPLGVDGSYNVSFPSSGVYHAWVKSPHFLRRQVEGTVDTSPDVAIVPLATLTNGDVDGDNAVTVFDYNALSDAFDTSPGHARWNPNADLDGDGTVSVFDYNVLSQSFDAEGD